MPPFRTILHRLRILGPPSHHHQIPPTASTFSSRVPIPKRIVPFLQDHLPVLVHSYKPSFSTGLSTLVDIQFAEGMKIFGKSMHVFKTAQRENDGEARLRVKPIHHDPHYARRPIGIRYRLHDGQCLVTAVLQKRSSSVTTNHIPLR